MFCTNAISQNNPQEFLYLRYRSKAEGSNRVYRGGSWNNNADNCRVANRNNNHPGNRNNNLGFRLAFVPQIEGMAGWQTVGQAFDPFHAQSGINTGSPCCFTPIVSRVAG